MIDLSVPEIQHRFVARLRWRLLNLPDFLSCLSLDSGLQSSAMILRKVCYLKCLKFLTQDLLLFALNHLAAFVLAFYLAAFRDSGHLSLHAIGWPFEP